MSYEAFQYLNKSSVSDGKLKAYYDFSTGQIVTETSSPFFAYVKNSVSENSGKAFVIGATGVNSGLAYNLGTGYVQNGAQLTQGNVLITGDQYLSGVPFNDCSVLCIFEREGVFKDGVLFGSLFETGYSYGDNDYSAYFGFNVGLTDRGHLFVQSPSPSGIEINVCHSIELTRKNIVSFSVSNGEAKLGIYDPINQSTKSEQFNIWNNPNRYAQHLVFGGSDLYFGKGSFADTSFSGRLESLALFSGEIPLQTLGQLSSGMMGDYFYDSGSISYTTGVTGVTTTPLYGTGITGYATGITGYQYVLTGWTIDQEIVTGSTSSVLEGERGIRFNNGFVEEVGMLLPANFGIYNPSDESASGTLGLKNDLLTYTGYTTQKITQSGFYAQPLYGLVELTGSTSEVTGYIYTELTGLVFDSAVLASSGTSFTGIASPYFKNRIHFVGQ
jgi:hypothetical protein